MSKSSAGKAPSSHSFLQHAAAMLLAPVPLGLLQPLFTHIARHVAQSRPELFDRLGQHAGKRFLIDPTDLPFTLLLIPTAAAPRMTLYRRHDNPTHDAAISGSFLNLLELIDGSLDGDALFFSRVLRVTGDTEAIVALRTAVDAGADAVYCGLQNETNARNFAGLNYTPAELEKSLGHAKQCKVLLAVNTFPPAGRFDLWSDAIDLAARLSVDAVIVADMGVADYAARTYPTLRLHLSV